MVDLNGVAAAFGEGMRDDIVQLAGVARKVVNLQMGHHFLVEWCGLLPQLLRDLLSELLRQ